MAYTDVFGGAMIYPSEISYSAVALSANITLSWPEETSTNVNLATKIMDVTPSAGSLSITLPDASKSGTGNTILFNNLGSYAFIVKNSAGTTVVTVTAGTIWQVYLDDNTTASGGWRSVQFGTGVSSVNAADLAGYGLVAAGTTLAQSMPATNFSINYTAGAANRAAFMNWIGVSGTLTLPSPFVVGAGWYINLRNSGTGNITASSPTLIDGASTLIFGPTDSAIIACDGTNYYTIGFGQSAVFAFDNTVIDVGGGTNYTLTGSQLNRVSYKFTGVLTADIAVIVPATVQQYWVDNATTGAHVLSVSSAAGGTNVAVTQGGRAILYCDGTNVLNANTAGVSLPLTISQGGTGAITASAARINIGGTSVGIAVFTAASQAAAWAALGVAQAGVVDGGTF